MIHPTAVVDARAELGADVEIGPFVVIEGRVSLGPGTAVLSHSVLKGHTVVGARCRIGPGAYVGLDPQHRGFAGQETSLVVGDDTVVREGATVHRAFKPGIEHATRVGQRCLLMAMSHVAHDCVVGDDVTLANAVLLGGHVRVGDRAFLGGSCAVHQFGRVGRLVIVSGNEAVTHDVPPFAAVRYGGMKGYNAIGCRRAGIAQDALYAIRSAYRCIHTHRTTPAALAAIAATVPDLPEVREILDFIRAKGRGLQPSVRFQRGRTAGDDAADENGPG